MKLLCALQCGGVNGEAIHDQAQPVDAGGEVAYGKSDLPFAREVVSAEDNRRADIDDLNEFFAL